MRQRYAWPMPKGSHIGDYDPLALVYMLIVFAAALLVPALIMRFSQRPVGFGRR